MSFTGRKKKSVVNDSRFYNNFILKEMDSTTNINFEQICQMFQNGNNFINNQNNLNMNQAINLNNNMGMNQIYNQNNNNMGMNYNQNINQMMPNFYQMMNNQNNNANMNLFMMNNPNNMNNVNNINMNQLLMNMMNNQNNNVMMNNMNMNQLMNLYMQMMNNNMSNNSNNNMNIDNDNYLINIVFIISQDNGLERTINLLAKPSQSFGSVITKLIEKTNDYNPHIYFFNSKRLDESKTVEEQGLINGATIFVVNPEIIIGAQYK